VVWGESEYHQTYSACQKRYLQPNEHESNCSVVFHMNQYALSLSFSVSLSLVLKVISCPDIVRLMCTKSVPVKYTIY
jgi:hypothetical protein